jgi:uncharacterized small protein (DUF1192 family)
MNEIHIVAVNPGDTLDDFIAYLAEDSVGALDGATFSERDAEIAQLRAEIAALRAQLNAVPVDSLRRYCDCIAYDGGKSFHSIPLEYDELQINMWFESLEDDDE